MKKRNVTIAAILIAILLIGVLAISLRNRRTAKPGESHGEPPRVTFLVPEGGVEIARDYNQLVMIPIRNDGPGVARLRIESGHFPDFPAGFVGRGTPDWETPDTVLEIGPGETWESPLMLHANHPQQAEYRLDLTARHDGLVVGSNPLLVKIEQPQLALAVTWQDGASEIDRARLVRRLVVRNTGHNVADLALRFEPAGGAPARAIHFEPEIERAWLKTGESLEVRVAPYLHPAFEKLEGELVLSGLGQEMRVPYLATVPEGQAVFVTLSRTTSRTSNEGRRCTNSPRATYTLPPTSGTPSDHAWAHDDGWGGGFAAPAPVAVTPPVDAPEPAPAEEEEDRASWSLFGPLSDPPAEESKPKPAEPAETVEEEAPPAAPDDTTFDLLDDNAVGVTGGHIGNAMPIDTPPGETGEKTASTFVDADGRRTHMTRRPRPDGTEFVNFGWGMQGEGRRLGGRTIRTGGVAPRPGPNPRPGAPALLNYTEPAENGGSVVKALDPETGESIVLSDPGKPADSPVSLRIGGAVNTLFREGGTVRGVSLGKDRTPSPAARWPVGEATGPLLAAVETPSGPAILTDEGGGNIAYRAPGRTTTHAARSASLAVSGDETRLALLDEAGAISIVDPASGETVHTVPGNGYGAPSLLAKDDGGFRMFFAKPLADHNATAPADTGTALGGNFSIDSKDGAWGEPRRVFLPEAPVTDAVVAVEVSAPFDTAHYKKMDTDIHFNGRRLQRLEGEVPFGRYLYHVPASALAYRSTASGTGNARNEVVIDAKGIGPGNFHLTDKCAVYATHEWSQACLVAATGADADRIARASSPEMRHDAPDVVLATNGSRLPRDLQPGRTATLALSAFNAGDLTSPAGEVTVSHRGAPVGTGKLPAMRAFRGAPVEIEFTVPPDWTPGESLVLDVSAPADGDADAATNSLQLPLLRELLEPLAGPTGPSRVDLTTLAPDSITDVPPGAPFTTPLEKGRLWFRVPVAETGALQLEVTGAGADGVDRIDLFDADGNAIAQQGGQWTPPGNALFVRVGYPPDASIPADTELKIWWE